MTEPVAPVLYVDIKESKTKWPLKRVQKWYFLLLVAGNHEPLARSTDMYTNFDDCEAAARQAHDYHARVFLRRPERGDELLRWPCPEPF